MFHGFQHLKDRFGPASGEGTGASAQVGLMLTIWMRIISFINVDSRTLVQPNIGEHEMSSFQVEFGELVEFTHPNNALNHVTRNRPCSFALAAFKRHAFEVL